MVKVTFDSVKVKGRVRGECTHPGCGKSTQLTKEFSQTLNPWNKDENGNVRTRSQIHSELIKQRTEWEKTAKDNLRCRDHR